MSAGTVYFLMPPNLSGSNVSLGRESGLENILLNMKILFKGNEINIGFDLRLEDGGRTQTTLPTLVAPFYIESLS